MFLWSLVGCENSKNLSPNMEPATPPAPAAGVTATVDLSPVAADLGGAHLLPCGIRQNGGAPVSDYFKPRATGPFPLDSNPSYPFSRSFG